MKKIKTLLIAAIFSLLICSNAYMIYASKKNKSVIGDFKNQVLRLEKTKEQAQRKITNSVDNLYVQFEKETVLTNSRLETVLMRDIFTYGEKLCLYFTESMCSPCVEAQIDQFRAFAQKYGEQQLCFFISTKNPESIERINYQYQTNIPFYHIEKEQIPFTNSFNKPVVFILNDILSARACYVPESELSKLNDVYYESIEHFFAN